MRGKGKGGRGEREHEREGEGGRGERENEREGEGGVRERVRGKGKGGRGEREMEKVNSFTPSSGSVSCPRLKLALFFASVVRLSAPILSTRS